MREEEQRFVAGTIFDKIEVDPGVIPNLQYCLYCRVIDNKTNNDSNYQIPLKGLNGDDDFKFKQCPSCKRIYILGDPTK